MKGIKSKKLQENLKEHYPKLSDDKNIEIKCTAHDVGDYQILSKKYYKLIILDQYGIKHLEKIHEFLCKGTDILIFVSSGHIRRFCEDQSFQKYINISKEDFAKKSFYETHRTVVEYLRRQFPRASVSPFTLAKDNENVNGLVFFSNHQKGQEQFLKAAWKVDATFGEGNCNIDADIEKDEKSLFYNPDTPSLKFQKFEEELKDYLKETRSNTDIREFSFNHGFLTTHTQKILEKNKHDLEIRYYGNKRGFQLREKEKLLDIKLKKIENEEN